MAYGQDEYYQEYMQQPKQQQTYDGKRMRTKPINRKSVDYATSVVNHIINRQYSPNKPLETFQPHYAYAPKMTAPLGLLPVPESSISTRFIHSSTNKQRCPVNCLAWTPEGRRLITGTASGEFTLWNGLAFNFETILQAHDVAIRSMNWTHNENWMVSGDQEGEIKYWQPNMNNVKSFKGHKEAVRDISFSKTDSKFVTCSDDVTIKIWDFAQCKEEATLTGHGWDVKCVEWHPYNSLVVSGSKDFLIKLWDAKSQQNVATLHGHKNSVVDISWNRNGNWVLSASRDQLLKLYDIRTMKELQAFRGHKREVTALSWHPHHEDFFVSGGFDGAIFFWKAEHPTPVSKMIGAHENSVWSLAWHPIGHILASGSNDHTTKFWCRQKPGDPPLIKVQKSLVQTDIKPKELVLKDDDDEEMGENKPEIKGEIKQEMPVETGDFLSSITPGFIGDTTELQLPGLGPARPPAPLAPLPVQQHFHQHLHQQVAGYPHGIMPPTGMVPGMTFAPGMPNFPPGGMPANWPMNQGIPQQPQHQQQHQHQHQHQQQHQRQY